MVIRDLSFHLSAGSVIFILCQQICQLGMMFIMFANVTCTSSTSFLVCQENTIGWHTFSAHVKKCDNCTPADTTSNSQYHDGCFHQVCTPTEARRVFISMTFILTVIDICITSEVSVHPCLEQPGVCHTRKTMNKALQHCICHLALPHPYSTIRLIFTKYNINLDSHCGGKPELQEKQVLVLRLNFS